MKVWIFTPIPFFIEFIFIYVQIFVHCMNDILDLCNCCILGGCFGKLFYYDVLALNVNVSPIPSLVHYNLLAIFSFLKFFHSPFFQLMMFDLVWIFVSLISYSWQAPLQHANARYVSYIYIYLIIIKILVQNKCFINPLSHEITCQDF